MGSLSITGLVGLLMTVTVFTFGMMSKAIMFVINKIQAKRVKKFYPPHEGGV